MTMTKAKQDRRIERSKRALTKALIELMVENGYEAASVADIAERANVGRSTFYAHYADKEDLLRESLHELRGYLAEAGHSPEEPDVHPALSFSLPMLKHVSEVEDLFRAIVTRRSTAQDLVHEMLVELVEERLTDGTQRASKPRLCAQHVVGSFLAICSWWMTSAPELTPEHVNTEFRLLVQPGLVLESKDKSET